MDAVTPTASDMRTAVLARADFQALIDALKSQGYTVYGPTVADAAVTLDEIESADDLPAGVGDRQDGGVYRLETRDDGALFGHGSGPHSWKGYLWPARQHLWRARRQGSDFRVDPPAPDDTRRALLGVRACDLAAIQVQDRVFDNGDFQDTGYLRRRANALVVAVNCGQAGGTCFCADMGTGPRADSGFDLALTELVGDGRHDFLIEAATDAGHKVLDALPVRDARDDDRAAADRAVQNAVDGQGRRMPEADSVPDLLMRHLESDHWREIAQRCLSCANCTMVCPTCFCSTVEDSNDLSGDITDRWRQWDSCFTLDLSYIHGGAVRIETASRYRQWMTHKLSTWHGQFGTSGCVGCGRCITWCPVGIDITEEVQAFRDSERGDADG